MNETTRATMRPHDRRRTPARKLEDTEALRNELDSALRKRGIVLPSLQVDPLAYGDADPQPLIDLGRCTPETARKLMDMVRKPRP